ncbi:ANTAR domain-containing protein [Naumannella sp. ID2617S]|uniref:ANTAR domain-containing protein n=1 Tax=Enemella dayhoffiae TaxID=2016507 RepID=A0A255HDH6_9ACTN|nr:GAF and ANTAR domain-containing protein [Enemella dayhoffiae]NNG19769.1 ANTAR domain-containing protein [Naumannella sp. ID2617S]OYO25023.1 hypothetical protein CGZ93_00705 [Enemella dayhoffiae]
MADHHPDMSGDIPVSALLSELMAGEPTTVEVLSRVVRFTVRLLERVDGASITIFGDDMKPYTMVASDAWVERADELQYKTQQGPCIEVAATSAPTSGAGDLAQNGHWPVFGPQVADLGIGALLAAGLCGHPDPARPDSPPGALNLYSFTPYAFTDGDRDQAVLIAGIAGMGVRLAEARATADRLREAITSRDVIGQAKGILMERHGVDEQQAFAILRRASNHLNVKLRDIAEELATERGRPVNGTGRVVALADPDR